MPYIAVIGDKEAKAGSVAVRKRGEGDKGAVKSDEFIERLKKEITVKQ